MEKTKLISQIISYILSGFIIVGLIWSVRTGLTNIPKYLYLGIIVTGLISWGFQVAYLIQAKKYKELKQFFLGIIIMAVVICFLLAADERVMLFGI